VAFAGGTALGFAHVGILKWLEANHVPIDFVAGTSMGGLVGGMCAVGSHADEICNFVRGVEWAKVFGPATPYPQLGFRRKQDFRDLANTVEFGWRGHLRRLLGLNAGEGVSLLISRFAAPYSNMKTFDDLPTPFRCVATDLMQRKQVVLGNGLLSTAHRATMSLPGIFDPVQMGQMSLVDGGVLDNLPVNVVKKMGAEIVIAVTLGADGPYPRSLHSLMWRGSRWTSCSSTTNGGT
jgi:NTE family protein